MSFVLIFQFMGFSEAACQLNYKFSFICDAQQKKQKTEWVHQIMITYAWICTVILFLQSENINTSELLAVITVYKASGRWKWLDVVCDGEEEGSETMEREGGRAGTRFSRRKENAKQGKKSSKNILTRQEDTSPRCRNSCIIWFPRY